MNKDETMTDARSLSQDKLTGLIAETEDTLQALKAELGNRERDAQHAEIEKLEEHLEEVETGLRSVRDFFRLLLGEIRERRRG